jgi:hypothetical protein
VLARAGVIAAGGWLAAGAVLTLSRQRYGRPEVSALASTASGVAHGRVWTLLTSMLLVGRYPFCELAGCALTVLAALWLLDGLSFWFVALASHIGAALMVYAGIGVVWIVSAGAASDLAAEQDYGISAIWFGALGAIAVVLHRRGFRRTGVIVAAAAVAASVALVAVSDELPFAEHLVALAIGAATARSLAAAPLRTRRLSPHAEAPPPREARPPGSAGVCPSARMAANPVRARPSDPS